MRIFISEENETDFSMSSSERWFS